VQHLLRLRAVEGGVAGAAQQPRREHEQRRGGRVGGVERGHDGAVRRPARPVDAEGDRAAPQRLDVLLRGGRQRAEQADLGVEHECGRGRTGEQADGGVPPLDGQLRAQDQGRPAGAVDDDLLLRRGQVDRPALARPGLPQPADLAQQLQRLRRRAGVERALHALVVELRARAHERPAHVGGGRARRRRRGRAATAARAGGPSGSRLAARSPRHRRVQRHPAVGAYSVTPRCSTSASSAPPATTNAPTSAMAYDTR
jgi:hypothetical protein